MTADYDFSSTDFLEFLDAQDSSLKVKLSLNCQLLKAEYDRNGFLVNEFSFGEIVLQSLKVTHLCGSNHNLAVETEIRNSIDYIANELLDNSIKYSDVTASNINLEIDITQKYVTIISKNLISKDRYGIFLNYIREIQSSDPSELYIYQLEKSLNDNCQSGLGLLSIMNDYKAEVNWKFDFLDCNCEILSYVMVQFPIKFK